MMLIRILFIILCMPLFVSCSTGSYLSHEHESMVVGIEQKESNLAFLDGSTSPITPIEDSNLFAVKTWYSNQEVLYLKGNSSFGTSIIKYNIKDGSHDVFFETNHTIIQVHASKNRNYFVLESKDILNNSIVSVIDKEGMLQYERNIPADLVEFAWNPYVEERIMITYYLPSFDTEIEIIDLGNKENVTNLSIVPYVQWFNSNQIAYFNWTGNTSLTAPIEIYELPSNNVYHFVDNALGFDSVQDYFMYVEQNEDSLVFHFYDSHTKSKLNSFKIPLIDSHAGYVWTPFFYWDEHSKIFYTYEPEQAGSVLDYGDGFQLISYNIETGEKKELKRTDFISPIECSTDGKLCLMGDRFEKIMNLETGKTFTLFE